MSRPIDWSSPSYLRGVCRARRDGIVLWCEVCQLRINVGEEFIRGPKGRVHAHVACAPTIREKR